MPPRRYHAAIFLTIFGVYLLTAARGRPWGDAQVMYEVAESIVHRGAVDIAYEWPPMSHRGPDGGVYSIYSLLPSLVSVPGALLRKWITALLPDSDVVVWRFTVHLAHAALTAWACALFAACCSLLGFDRKSSTLATLALAFATLAWVYARQPYSEAVQLFAMVLALHRALRWLAEPTPRQALWLGVAAGVLVNTKWVFLVSIAGAGAILLWQARRHGTARTLATWSAAGFTPLFAIALAYNHARWGSPFTTGYEVALPLARESLLWGLWGLFFSPGKSVFLYAPPIVLGLLGLRRFREGRDLQALLALALVVPPILVYARFLNWAGGWCWGPRHLVFAMPFFMLPVVAWLAIDDARRRARWIAFALVSLVGVFVQIVGGALYWDHWIRVSKQASFAWLGEPDRAGAAIPERGRGHCDSCIEDMHGPYWLPALQPIEGHAWLLWHVARETPWEEAERGAPWRRYTTLELPLRKAYERARVDWWPTLWMRDEPRWRGVGIVLALALTGTIALGAAAWRSALREERRASEDRS